MARSKRKTNEPAEETPPATEAPHGVQSGDAAAAPQASAEPDQADGSQNRSWRSGFAAEQSQPEGEPRQWTSSLPDPFKRHSIDLGDGRRLQLNRSSKWHQMQIQFIASQEGVDPKPKKEDGDTQWLRERGWQWRGDPDTKAWTVQLLKPEEKELPDDQKAKLRAATDRQAEQDFIELAQRVRARNGLPPASVFAGAERGA